MSERDVVRVRAHAGTLLGPALLLLAVAALTGAGLGWAAERGRPAGLAVALVAAAAVTWGTLRPFLGWWTTTYSLTTRRLGLRWGVLSRHGRDVPLSQVVEVRLERSLGQRLVGSGTLHVGTAAEEEEIVLPNLPQVQRLHATLLRLCGGAPAEARELQR
jgi:uncharacterized membrane protein YdbT with pleckstrin-like domain